VREEEIIEITTTTILKLLILREAVQRSDRHIVITTIIIIITKAHPDICIYSTDPVVFILSLLTSSLLSILFLYDAISIFRKKIIRNPFFYFLYLLLLLHPISETELVKV